MHRLAPQKQLGMFCPVEMDTAAHRFHLDDDGGAPFPELLAHVLLRGMRVGCLVLGGSPDGSFSSGDARRAGQGHFA